MINLYSLHNSLNLSVVERLEIVRKEEGLNKAQFERTLNKSTGYLNMLMRRGSSPSVDVIQKFSQTFPDYSLNWLMTGKGSMKKDDASNEMNEPVATYQSPSDSAVILAIRDDLKNDLSELSKGVTKNFETLSSGVMRLLQDQQKILKFINTIDAEKISDASSKLNEFLKKENNNNN